MEEEYKTKYLIQLDNYIQLQEDHIKLQGKYNELLENYIKLYKIEPKGE